MKKPRYVLDSYALVAYLQNEAEADQVETLLDQAHENSVILHMSFINLGEIAYLVARRRGADRCEEVLKHLTLFPIHYEEVPWERILAAAQVKAQHAISYADAFAVALAQEMDATLVTGDPEFKQVESLIPVLWL